MQEFTIDKHNKIIAESEGTRYGFRHVVRLLKDGHEVDKKSVPYYNRTWESFEFESAMKSLLDKHPEIKEKTKEKFFAKAGGHYQAKVESQFKTTASVASLGNVFGKSAKERADWKQRMLKASLPELQIPEDWNKLSDEEREARLDKVIELAHGQGEHKKKKKLGEMS